MGRGSSQAASSAAPSPTRHSGASLTPFIKRPFYRAGGITKASDYGLAQASYVAADAVKPEGRVGRLEGLFCVESLQAVAPWVNGSLTAGRDYDPNPVEIFYTGPEPWVYPVRAWSSIGSWEHKGPDAYLNHYWNKGLPLSQFEQQRDMLEQESVWGDGGEIIIDPQFITSHRSVSLTRLAKALPERRDLIERLKRFRNTGHRF